MLATNWSRHSAARSSALPSAVSSGGPASNSSGEISSPRACLSRSLSSKAMRASSIPPTGGSPHAASSASTVMTLLQEAQESRGPELAEGPETEHPERPRAAAEPLADLGVGQPLEPEQLDHLPLLLGEQLQRRGHL